MKLLTKNSLRIVHVEDNNNVAEITAVLLKMKGFTAPINRLDCGEAAVEYLSNVEPAYAPHLILLDLQLPGLSGLEVLHWLRHEYWDASVPVCILSGSVEASDIRKSFAAGATKYFLKSSISNGLSFYLNELVKQENETREFMRNFPSSLVELAFMSKFTENIVVLTDPNGLLVWANESFVKTCGYTVEEVRGRKPGRVLQGRESDQASVKALRNAVRTATPCECKIVNYRKSGKSYPVHISLGPVFANDGNLDGFLAVERELVPSQK